MEDVLLNVYFRYANSIGKVTWLTEKRLCEKLGHVIIQHTRDITMFTDVGIADESWK